MKSECCKSEMSMYLDEDYNKIFYTCLDCGLACVPEEVDNNIDNEVDMT